MVAYSFKSRFAAPILAGTKRQTIRADRKRHARAGEELQLYTGMRTRQCKLIGRAKAVAVGPITLNFAGSGSVLFPLTSHFHPPWLDAFARLDGFDSWDDLRLFWATEHGDLKFFEGVIIQWGEVR